MTSPRLAGTLRGALVSALGLGAVCVATTGCSKGPATPGELFDQGYQAMVQGRPGLFWDLMTRDQQDRVRKQIDGTRETMRKNPGARNLADQWLVTYDEFQRLPPPELWSRAHKGTERVLPGLKILDAAVDPETGRDVVVTFETVFGQQFRWVMRYEADRGWRFQDQAIIASGEQPTR